MFTYIYLQNGEILQHTVHHVLFGQVLELLNEIDHVFAHRRPMDAIHEARVLQSRVFGFDLLDHLLAERADLRRARDHHVVVALVSGVRAGIGSKGRQEERIKTFGICGKKEERYTYWLVTP